MNSQDYWDSDTTHPANKIEYDIEFESHNLTECMNYFKDTKDIELLENAIDFNEVKLDKAINDLQFLIDFCRTTDKDFLANRLINIRNSLKNDTNI